MFLKLREESELRTVYYNVNCHTKSIEMVDTDIDI